MSKHREELFKLGRTDLVNRIEALEAKIEELENPGFEEFVETTNRWLQKYPESIFTSVSGDSGALFVVAVRNAIKAMGEAK